MITFSPLLSLTPLLAFTSHPYVGPVVALIAGILILIRPSLLAMIVAIYLIIIGILGLLA